MTNWDDRLAAMKAAEDARAQAARDSQLRSEREKQERDARVWAQIRDLARWSVDRYTASGKDPVPIVARWEVRLQRLLTKDRREVRREYIGMGYPLAQLQYRTEFTESYGTRFDNLVLIATSDLDILSVFVGPDLEESKPPLREVTMWLSEPLANRADSLLESCKIRDADRLVCKWAITNKADQAALDQLCDRVIRYVGRFVG